MKYHIITENKTFLVDIPVTDFLPFLSILPNDIDATDLVNEEVSIHSDEEKPESINAPLLGRKRPRNLSEVLDFHAEFEKAIEEDNAPYKSPRKVDPPVDTVTQKHQWILKEGDDTQGPVYRSIWIKEA